MEAAVAHDVAVDALHARFLRGLAVAPDGVALRVGAARVTYAQAHKTALLWAGALVEAGARAVGVLTAKGVTAYVGTLAALYAGAAVVPLRPDFPPSRTRQMVLASGASVLLVDDKGLAALPALLAAEPGGGASLAGERDGASLAGEPGIAVLAPGRDRDTDPPVRWLVPDPAHALARPRDVRPADPAYTLFTSGSTGRPKGVVITHGNTGHYFRLLDARYDFDPADVFTQTFDMNFDCALFDMFCAWGAGATVLPVPPLAYRDLPVFLAERGITVWFSTPSAIDLVRRMGGLAAAAMPGLRWSFFAGEGLKCRDAADWQRAAPASTVENLYGPTELTVTVAVHRWSEEVSPGLAVNGVVPIGVLHEGHDHLLLDAVGEPAGTEGELCVAGPQLTPGYLDPADGRGRFLDRDGRRWYRTGDRVRRVGHGQLAYLGRLDSQVQVQGVRVELAEVEQALRACGVDDAVAVGVPGPASTELVAFYTGAPVPAAEIVRRLRRLVPDAIIPRHYRHIDEFPLNANRKVDRARLAAQAGELLGSGGTPAPEGPGRRPE